MRDETLDPDGLFDFLAESGLHRGDPETHPSPETLTAYQANELSPEDDERIQDHLAACRHCTEMLLELETFLKPAEGGQERLVGSGTAPGLPGKAPAEAGPRREPPWRSLRAAYSLAALLAVALTGVSIYAGSLRQELRTPVAEVASEVLLANGSERSPQGERKPVRLPTTLTLVVSAGPSFPEYRAEFRRHGKVIHSVGKLYLQDDQWIQIFLPKSSIQEGLYQIVLWGVHGESREELGTYDVRIMT